MSSILDTITDGIKSNEESLKCSSSSENPNPHKRKLSALPNTSQYVFVVILIPSISDIADEDQHNNRNSYNSYNTSLSLHESSKERQSGKDSNSNRVMYWSFYVMDPQTSEIPSEPKQCWMTKFVDPKELLGFERNGSNNVSQASRIGIPRAAYIETGTIDEEHLEKEILEGMWDSPEHTAQCLQHYLCDDLLNYIFGDKSKRSPYPNKDALNQAFLRMKEEKSQNQITAKRIQVYLICNMENVSTEVVSLARMWRHTPSSLVAPSPKDFLHFINNSSAMPKKVRECKWHHDVPVMSAFSGAIGYLLKVKEEPKKPAFVVVLNITGEVIKCITAGLFGLSLLTNRKDISCRCFDKCDSTYGESGGAKEMLLSTKMKISSMLNEVFNSNEEAATSDIFIFITGAIDQGKVLYSLLAEKSVDDKGLHSYKKCTKSKICDQPCSILFNPFLHSEGFTNVLRSINMPVLRVNRTKISENNTADDAFIGERVAKYFNEDVYYGTVRKVEMIKKKKHWLIDYDDGDSEHVSKVELMTILNLYEKSEYNYK